MKARSRSSSAFHHRTREAQAEIESSKPSTIVQGSVERFFAWISRNRRLWKDPEATLTSARAFLYAASVMLLTRRLARLS
jgi:hypothetical protein